MVLEKFGLKKVTLKYTILQLKQISSKVAVVAGNALDKSGKFIVAKLDDLNIISIETNLAFPFISEGNEGITVKADGKILKIKKVTSDEVMDGTTTVAKIELSENVKLSQKLTVSKSRFRRKRSSAW